MSHTQSNNDKFYIGFETDEWGAGVFDIRKRGKMTKEQFQKLVDILRNDLLENFKETRVLNFDNVYQQLQEEFENFSVEIDPNISERDLSIINEMFGELLGSNGEGSDTLDLCFIVVVNQENKSVSLSSEGSEEKLFEMFQEHGFAY